MADMLYNLEDIEDQLIATLKANTFINAIKADVDTHAGEINATTFMNLSMMEGVIKRVPFIAVQYQGLAAPLERDAVGAVYINTCVWRFYAAAKSLRTVQEAQRSYAYPMLRAIYASIHGMVPLMDPTVQAQKLPGAVGFLLASAALPLGIATVGFNPQSPFLKLSGQSERIVANHNGVICYQTDYAIRLQT